MDAATKSAAEWLIELPRFFPFSFRVLRTELFLPRFSHKQSPCCEIPLADNTERTIKLY